MSSGGAADTNGSSQWWGQVLEASWPGHSFPAGCPHLEKHSGEMEAQLSVLCPCCLWHGFLALYALLRLGFLALCP